MNDYTSRIGRFEFSKDPDNDMIVGPNGCHYDTEAEAMYFDQLGLCGCGNPGKVHEFLLGCLKQTGESGRILSHEKVTRLVEQNAGWAAEFILHFLDQKNLVEHGGSVYGCWLTERGEQFLELGAHK